MVYGTCSRRRCKIATLQARVEIFSPASNFGLANNAGIMWRNPIVPIDSIIIVVISADLTNNKAALVGAALQQQSTDWIAMNDVHRYNLPQSLTYTRILI